MKPCRLLLVTSVIWLFVGQAFATNPEISLYQKAISQEPPGQFENSYDGQVAVSGQNVHITYYSSVKVDNWTGAGTNRLWYRRSTDGGQTFEPAVLIAQAPASGPDGTVVMDIPFGTRSYLAVDGNTVYILNVRSVTGGGWYYMLDYYRSTDGGATFEYHPNLVTGERAYWLRNPIITAANGKATIAYGYGQNWTGLSWMKILSSTDNGATFVNTASLDQGTWGASLAGLSCAGNKVAVAWQNDFWSTRSAYVGASTDGGATFAISRVNDVDAGGYGGVSFLDSTGSGGGSIRPKLAWSGNSLYAAWTGIFTNDTSVLRAFLARSTNGGASFEPQQCLSLDMPGAAGKVAGGHITVAAKGRYVYVVFNTENGRVFLKRSMDAGEVFQPIQELGDPASTTASGGWWNLLETDPNVADGSKVHFFTGDYYRCSTDGGATFTGAAHLSTYYTANNQVNRAQMALDQDGSAHFVWDTRYWTALGGTDYDDWDVFHRRYSLQAPALAAENQALKLERGVFDQTRDAGGLRRDNLQIPNCPALNFSNAVTVELWFRPNTNCSVETTLLQRESPDHSLGAFLLQTHSGNGRRPSAKLLTTNGVVELWGGTLISDDTWHHLALTYDASAQSQNARLYVDGHLEAVADASGFLNPNAGIIWVGGPGETSKQFQGTIDEMRFWNRALTLEEVRSSSANRMTGSEPGLAACYPLDGSTRELTGNAPDAVLMYREAFIPETMATPLFTSAGLTGARQGSPFVHQVVADFAAGYSAANLPEDLTLNSTTGLISGTAQTPGVFDTTITATNDYGGTASQTLRIIVNANTNLLFREDFNNGLSGNWDGTSADTNYYSFQAGVLDLRANNGETWQGVNSPVNLFAFANTNSGDMVITLGVARYEPSAQNYNRLCLAAWDDYDNNIRLAYGYGGGRQVEILGEQAQAMTQATAPLDLGAQPFLLRVVKQGGGASDRYTGYYSTNGVDFLPFPNDVVYNGDGSPNLLGFWMGIDPLQNNHAYIDYFEVAALPQTNLPPAYTDNFSPGNGAAAWRIENKAGLYTVDQSQGVMAFSKSYGGSGAASEWAGAYSAATLVGDFDVSVDYRDPVLPKTGGGWGNQIQLNCSTDGQYAGAIRGNEPGLGGENVHVWFNPPSSAYGVTASTATSGTLRLIRSGTLIKAYHDGTFLGQRNGNTNPATIWLSLQNNGTADTISAKFDNFRASAEQVILATPAFTTPALALGLRGQPFAWQIAAEYGATLTAKELPPGLVLDERTGLISGTPTQAGVFQSLVTASNSMAFASQNLRFIINDSAVTASPAWDMNILPQGLIAWWQAESNMLDSALHHDGAGSSDPTYKAGRYGQAFQFDGTSQSVAIPDTYADLDSWNEFSMEAWINFDQISDFLGGRCIFSKVGGGGGNNGYQLVIDGDGTRINLLFNKPDQSWPGYVTSKTLAAPLGTNTWYHIAATYDHNAVKLYLDGVALITNVIGAATLRDSSSTLRLGKDDNGNGPFAGRIDDARIYNRALTENEIAYLYQGPPALSLRVPHITSASRADGRAGQAFSYQITADNAPSVFDAVGLPSGLTVDSATGLISGIPPVSGIFPVQLLAGNLYGTNTTTLTLDILPIPPAITSAASARGQMGVSFSYQISADNDPTWLGATSLPEGLAVDGSGLISGVPAADGSFTIQLSAGNRGGTNTASLALTVFPAAPVINSATNANGQVGVLFNYIIAASGAPTNFGAANLPAGLTINPTNGLIRGTPSDPGTFIVQLSAKSPYGSGLAALILTIAPPPTLGTFTEGFESSLVGWTLGQSPSIGPWYIQTSAVAHGGTNVAYSGILNSWREQSMTSPELTAGGSGVQLSFYHVHVNHSGDPAALGIIVTNGPLQWVKGYAGNPFGLGFTSGPYPIDVVSQLTNSNQYLHETIDLTPYLSNGDKFRLFFYTGADYNYPSPGWIVDDISVSGVVVTNKPSPPSLTLANYQAVDGANVISLAWTNNGAACILESVGALPGNWAALPNPAVTNGNYISISVTNSAPVQFFRLRGL